MDEAEQLLSRVGLVYPAGQPGMLRAHAENWQELANYLREHQDQLGTLLSQSQSHWQGESATTFRRHVVALVESSDETARVAGQLAIEQHKHANRHERVLEVIKELAIEIAVALAYIAVAAFFPLLLAAAKAYLALLVGTAGRLIGLLAEVLEGLVGFLVRAREAIERFGRLAVRTEGFSFGYGRLMTEGVKDFAIDLAASATSSAVQGKPLDAGKLFTSAGVSFGVGGLFGGIEASGVKKALDGAGAVRRGEDGRPVFVSLSDQYRKAVDSLGRSTSAPVNPAPTARPASHTGPWDEFTDAQKHARALNVDGNASEGVRLADDLAGAAARYRLARDRRETYLKKAEDHVRGTAGDVRVAAERLADAEQAIGTWRTLSDVYRASEQRDWIQDAGRQLSLAETAYSVRRQELDSSRAVHEQARQELAARRLGSQESAVDVARTAEEYRVAADRVAAAQRLSAAADRVRSETSLGQRLGHTWADNEWRNAFGEPRGWREYVLYDGVKDFLKGFTSNTALGGINAANGTISAGDIWKEALLGGASGSLRGMLNGRFNNVVFPGGGIEEIIWKIATKSMDKFVRDQIKPVIESDPTAAPPAR